MAKISDVYAGDYVSAGELPDGRRIAAVIVFAGIEQVGQDQQQKVVLTLRAPDGRPWPRKLVLNKTNAGILASVCGDETTAWTGRAIEIWKEPVSFQGKIVPGIKLSAGAPPPLPSGTAMAIPMPAPAPAATPGNGGIPGADGHTVPFPSAMPSAPSGGGGGGGGGLIDDEIPF